MGIKSQAATEYMIIVGFVIVILVPVIYLYVTYSNESQDSVINAKVDAISNEIIKAADQVYSYGEGSQTTIDVNFPERVLSVDFQGKEIIFTVLDSKGNQNEIAKVADIELEGYITVIEGIKKITVKSLDNVVSVFVECVEAEQRCGYDWECQYYAGGPVQGCLMRCSNNKWSYLQECSAGCGDGQCVA